MKPTLFILFFIIGEQLFSQTYSYQDYRSDQTTLFKINRHIRNNNTDSLQSDLLQYKNRLGFKYYQCKALIANQESDTNQLTFLDSAFMRGMTPLCIDVHLNKFDTAKVSASFRKNYLKSYNPHLINLIDSIHYEDQHYRQEIAYWARRSDLANPDSKTLADKQHGFKLNEQTKQQAIDSLWKIQSRVDSTNLIKLNDIIEQYGWPGAKKVGDYYCKRPGPDVTILFNHLGNTRREYQIATLKKVIALCEKQEDSWQNASSILFGLHSKFGRNFSEFSFLTIENNHLNVDKSFFSIYTMSEIIIQSGSKIEITCSNRLLFEEIKHAMVSVNDLISIDAKSVKQQVELGLPVSEKLTESSFIFVEAKELNDNQVLYKISKK